jgi:hypothetical protein
MIFPCQALSGEFFLFCCTKGFAGLLACATHDNRVHDVWESLLV